MWAARLAALALACAAVVAFLLLRRSGTDSGRNPAAASESQPGTPAAGPPTPAVAPTMPITPRAAANPPAVLDPAALASARATVQTELRLLEGGEQDLFRETFLPSVQP